MIFQSEFVGAGGPAASRRSLCFKSIGFEGAGETGSKHVSVRPHWQPRRGHSPTGPAGDQILTTVGPAMGRT